MEEQIKRAVRNLNISYVFFWVLPAFLLGAGEFELFPVGGLVDNAPAIYYFETVGILLTALCVPLSLKLFSLVLKKKIDHMTITLALKRYVQWNIVRLGVLEVAIVVNLLCYYLTLASRRHFSACPARRDCVTNFTLQKKKSYETVFLNERTYLSSCSRTGRYGHYVRDGK